MSEMTASEATAPAPAKRRRPEGIQLLAWGTMVGTVLLILADALQLGAAGGRIDPDRPLPPDLTTLPEHPSGPLQPQTTRRPEDGGQVKPFSPQVRPSVDGDGPSLPDGLGPLPQPAGESMTFSVATAENGTTYLLATGAFTYGTADAFRRYHEREGKAATVVLFDSPGGLVQEAVALGRYIRESGLSTLVYEDGLCASACPLAFAGGVERLAAETAWIGVHRAYVTERGTGDLLTGLGQGQQLAALCMEHLVEMGIASDAWIHALATPWSEIYFFTPEQLEDYALVTRFVT